MNPALERMAFLLTEAPEDIKPIFVKVKMDQDKSSQMKALGCGTINNEMMSKTLAYLWKCEVTDEKITRLVMKGKKMTILNLLWNLMPEQCSSCLKDYHHIMEEEPKVRCRRCNKGACPDCFPENVHRWRHLCDICDIEVGEQLALPEDALTAKEKDKGKKKDTNQSQATQSILSQNQYVVLSDEEEPDDDNEEERIRTEEIERKRENENRGRSKKSEEEKEKEEVVDAEKAICKAFKFGGKCPHGMSGKKSHGRWEQCNHSHPKVCSKLLAHGTRGSQGCTGRDCGKYHPRMCYGSMSEKLCTKEKCTYWHCKGTQFIPDSTCSYLPPSRSSQVEYPILQERRRGLGPVRGRMEERSRRGEPRQRREVWPETDGRGERREEMPRTEVPSRQRWEEKREDGREWTETEGRGERRREEDMKKSSKAFLDLNMVTNLIREEIQRAFHAALPAAVSGSVANLPRQVGAPGLSSWMEMLARSNTN